MALEVPQPLEETMSQASGEAQAPVDGIHGRLGKQVQAGG